jgi:hypothetical protein
MSNKETALKIKALGDEVGPNPGTANDISLRKAI